MLIIIIIYPLNENKKNLKYILYNIFLLKLINVKFTVTKN